MNWLWKWFTENVALKLLSLALATGLWAALALDPITESIFQVSMEFTGVPENLEVLPEQTTVQVRARGPSRAVRQSGPGDFSVKVDLAAATEGAERTYALNLEDVQGPSLLKIVQVVPAQVRLALEPTVTKNVAVHPQFSGNPAPGRRVKDFRVQPFQVRIAGPRSRVLSTTVVLTDPIDLTDLSGSRTLVTTAYVSDPLVRVVEPAVVKVMVELEISLPAEAKGMPQ